MYLRLGFIIYCKSNSHSRNHALIQENNGWLYLPVADVLCAGMVNFNDDKHVLEMGANVFGCEGQSTGLLKHDGHNVISYVSLSEQLVRERSGGK